MKKGMSTVVTTVIMVLLVIVAVGIVWVVVKNLISDTAEQVDADELLMDLSITGATNDSSSISIFVERKAGGGKLSAIKFAFFNGTDTEVIEKPALLEVLEEQSFTFSSFSVFATNQIITKVSIAPVVEMQSGETKVGNILHSIDRKLTVPS